MLGKSVLQWDLKNGRGREVALRPCWERQCQAWGQPRAEQKRSPSGLRGWWSSWTAKDHWAEVGEETRKEVRESNAVKARALKVERKQGVCASNEDVRRR